MQPTTEVTRTEKMLGGIRWIVTVTATDNPVAIKKAEAFMAECLVRKMTSLKQPA